MLSLKVQLLVHKCLQVLKANVIGLKSNDLQFLFDFVSSFSTRAAGSSFQTRRCRLLSLSQEVNTVRHSFVKGHLIMGLIPSKGRQVFMLKSWFKHSITSSPNRHKERKYD